MNTLPSFTLSALDGSSRSFPGAGTSLLCFVKEDCPTCVLTMPLIEAAHRAFGEGVEVLVVGQDVAGNTKLVANHGLTAPMLDDSALKISFAYDLDTVPTIILAEASGAERERFVGFAKTDWQALFATLAAETGKPTPATAWEQYPEWRPGCGSKSVEPGIYERLVAEAEGSPLRARRIDIGESDDVWEFMADQGLTDGLPVVPPTPERVLRMLSGTRRDPQEVVALIPPNMGVATVEKVAINAVMAGCKPEYLPVILTAVEAACTEEFNVHGVFATTMGAAPAMVVNGPIRNRIGMNMKLGALGQGNRANASIGRALRLVVRNVGGAKPGGTERSTLGSGLKFTMSFAEWEERSPWTPYHVEHGFGPGEDVVSLFPSSCGPTLIVDQTARTARALATTFGQALDAVGQPRVPSGDVLVVVCPEHADTLSRDGWSKDDLRRKILEVTSRPLRDLIMTDDSPGLPAHTWGPNGPSEEQLAQPTAKFRSGERIHIVVAGAEAGKFSAVFGGWASVPVSRAIKEPA